MNKDKSIPKQKSTGIPLIGLGTWQLNGLECVDTIQKALELGYRHIDTADIYQNHSEVGRGIKSGPREEIFLATKLYMNDLLPKKIEAAIPRFLEELDVSYIDLLLIHWPNPEVRLEETLEAMVAFQKKKIVRFIGISNFVRSHLIALAPYKFPVLVNQIELHPYMQRKTLVAECQKFGIGVTAYRPVAKGAFEQDPVLKKIGIKHGKTPSQIALRWILQQDISAIPKASSQQHLKDNISVFDFSLNDEEIKQISQLEEGRRFCNPAGLPIYED